MSLRIQKIKPTGNTFLSLEGTILIINESNRFVKSEVQIPVELISIYESQKFRAKFLIIALLSLAIPLLTVVISYGILFKTLNFDPQGIIMEMHIFLFFPLLLIGIVLFLIFLIKFSIRRKAVSLVISPNNFAIEFWKERKQEKEIDELLNQIEYRKSIIEESMIQPMQKSVGFGERRSMIPQLISSMILFSMPALITDNIKLLPIALIPLAFFIYKKIFELTKIPKLFRQALKHFFKEEWDNAINLLKTLKEQFPGYIPSYTLLISIYTRTNQYDEAMEIVSELPDQYNDLANNITSDIWRYKRINQRRTEPIPNME